MFKCLIFIFLGALNMNNVFANSLSLVAYDKLRRTNPEISGSNIKVWSVKKNHHIRINLVEFFGRLKRHVHPDAEHSLMILEGEIMAEVAGDKFKLSKGDFISIPQNTPHSYESISDKSVFVSMDAPYYDPNKTIPME
jgi:quercetin dioxygenase-like cupin family protein